MKKIILIGIVALSFVNCRITDKNEGREVISSDMIDNDNPGVLTFETDTYDFGEMALGSTIKFSFKFENTGDNPLIIHSVKASCGCTVLKEWPKDPIQPGEGGEIPVEFTPSVPGTVKKQISIIANTKPATSKVYITGTVVGVE